MLPLYLIAAHLVGDFLLQTRWQAATKINDGWARFRHVAAYTVPFIPLAAVYGGGGPFGLTGWEAAPVFLASLFVLHLLTDSARFYSTLGDMIGWRFRPMDVRRADWGHSEAFKMLPPDLARDVVRRSPPPNLWEPIPIIVDQTLHACQIALLAGLFLA